MKRNFRFSDRTSFRGKDSEMLAECLGEATEQIRQHVRSAYGLQIVADSKPMRVMHDGRKVGIGSFAVAESVVHFAILSKVQKDALSCMLSALSDSERAKGHVRFDSLMKDGPVTSEESEFAPAYQKALFEDIVKTLRRLSEVYTSKRIIKTRGGIRGRPLLRQSINNIVLGRKLEFQCEILNDQVMVPYVVALLATAKQLYSDLLEVAEFVPGMTSAIGAMYRSASSSYPGVDVSSFNRSLLYRVCRPPFPYNLRGIMLRCLRYWQSQGRFSFAEHGHQGMDYWGMIADMDLLFEDYIGKVLESTCNEFCDVRSSRIGYYTMGDAAADDDHSIKPDHIVVNRGSGVGIVVDAKYRTDIATSSQVAQIISYLSYSRFEEFDECEKKVGVLAYPGEEFDVVPIEGFDREIYAMRVPVREDLQSDEVWAFVESLA